MRVLLSALLLILPCVGYPTIDRADRNVLLTAIPTHIGKAEAVPPLDGRECNAMMVHIKPLRSAAELLITITYLDTEGRTNYAWRWEPVATGYTVVLLALPVGASVVSVDSEGFDEQRNSLWWSGFSAN